MLQHSFTGHETRCATPWWPAASLPSSMGRMRLSAREAAFADVCAEGAEEVHSVQSALGWAGQTPIWHLFAQRALFMNCRQGAQTARYTALTVFSSLCATFCFLRWLGLPTYLLQSKSFYLRLKLSLVKHSLMDSSHGFGFGWWRVSRSLPTFNDVLDPLCPLFMMLLLQALILHKRKSQERCYDEQQWREQEKNTTSTSIKDTV